MDMNNKVEIFAMSICVSLYITVSCKRNNESESVTGQFDLSSFEVFISFLISFFVERL